MERLDIVHDFELNGANGSLSSTQANQVPAAIAHDVLHGAPRPFSLKINQTRDGVAYEINAADSALPDALYYAQKIVGQQQQPKPDIAVLIAIAMGCALVGILSYATVRLFVGDSHESYQNRLERPR